MTNFSENENLINQDSSDTVETISEESSTIFSAPVEHSKKAKDSNKKKRWPVVISCLLAVAILAGGTVAVIKLIPEREEKTSSTPSVEEIEVLSHSRDDLKSITVNNKNGSFKLYPETTNTSGESNSSITNWYLDGYEKDVVSTSSIASIVSSVASIDASREVTKLSAADCGLETPTITVDIITTDDKQFSVLIGSESPDKSGYYLKLSDSDKIYVVDSSVQSTLEFTALSLADNSSMPGISTDDTDYFNSETGLITFDSLEISGKNFPKPLYIVPNNDDVISPYAQFVITSPEERIAENVDKVFNIFNSGVGVSGAYSFDVSANSLAAVGLDKPDFTATMKIKDISHTFKFKLQEDGCYAAVCDGAKVIKKVDASSLEFIDYTTTDFYASWVCLNSIDTLKSFTFKVGEKSYEFGIEANSDEDSDDKYIITIDGKTLTSLTFQNFYQECVSLSCNDFTVKDITATPNISIIFTFKDGAGEQVYDFVESDATKYQYSLNSVPKGNVSASSLNQLVKQLESIYNSIK